MEMSATVLHRILSLQLTKCFYPLYTQEFSWDLLVGLEALDTSESLSLICE